LQIAPWQDRCAAQVTERGTWFSLFWP
jgi:hypothetical protein